MKLFHKFLVSYILIIFITVIVGYLGIAKIYSIEKELNELLSDSSFVDAAVSNMSFASLRILSSTSEFGFIAALTGGFDSNEMEEERKLADQGKQLLLSSLKDYGNAVHRMHERNAIREEEILPGEIRRASAEILDSSEKLLDAIEGNARDQEILELKEKLEAAEMAFLSLMNETSEHMRNELEDARRKINASIRDSQNRTIALILLAMIAAIISCVILSILITKPIRRLAKAAEEIGKGNFEVKLDIDSKDEIGTFSSTLADMVEDLKSYHEHMVRQEKLRSVGVLAGGIAHDMNNLLAVILGNVSVLKMRMGTKDENVRYLENAERTIKQAT